jgi:hypothetical protein
MTPDHMCLSHRKELCARIMVVQALGRIRLNEDSNEKREALDCFGRSFDELLVTRIRKSAETEHLDDFLKRLFDESRLSGPSLILEDFPELRSNFFQIIDDLRKDLICEGCAKFAQTGKICEGYKDEATVTGAGYCIKQLKSAFQLTVRVAEEYYKKYLSQRPNLPSVDFSTEFKMEKPHGLEVDYRVGGKIAFEGDESSMITLQLCVRKFDWKSYLVVPYVLFHEVVAHAFADTVKLPGGRFGPREHPKDNHAFAEGWMDYVAYLVTNEFLGRRGCAASLCDTNEYNDVVVVDHLEHLKEAGFFHGSRYDTNAALRGEPKGNAHNRFKGKKSAERVLGLLELLPESKDNARMHFLRFSFRLNVEKRDVNVKENFISALYAGLEENGFPPHPTLRVPMKTAVTQAFRKYLVDDDLEEMVRAIMFQNSAG